MNLSATGVVPIQSSEPLLARNLLGITAELLQAFDEEATAELARRLEEDDYPTPFAGLRDWHLLRALAIHRPDLTFPYVHLVDQEIFDED